MLLGLVLCVGLGVTACTSNSQNKNNQDIVNKQEEQKYLTEEEKEEVSKKAGKNLDENIKYRFAKVISADGLNIDVEFTDLPEGYGDSGYNQNLDVDTSNLKLMGEKKSIDLVGVNINISELEDIKEGGFVRVGTYESESDENEFGFEKGKVLSVDFL